MDDSRSAWAIAQRIVAGESRAVDEVARSLELIDERDGSLSAWRSVQRDEALERASAIDAMPVERKRAMSLCGVPVVIKDNVAQEGRPLGAGRPDGAGQVAQDDAPVVRRLQEAGAIVVGRANMDELAYGVTGSNEHTGQVRNPWDQKRHPGGSSAGVGAAVAAGTVPLGVGTDTGGSVRIPASVCGLVGVRPTAGFVPTEGVAPLSRSLDTVGPLATCVRDVALALGVMAGKAIPVPEEARARKKKLVALEGAFALALAPPVAHAFDEMCGTLQKAGHPIDRVRVEPLARGPRASGPIIGAEASYAWAKELEEHPDWFGPQVAGLLRKGQEIKATRLLRAQDEARQVVEAVDALFQDAWVLLLPTTVQPASPVDRIGSQLDMLALTAGFSLGGWPSMSVPMARVDGMPVGLQLVAPRGEDVRLLDLAAEIERLAPWPATAF